MLEKWMDFHRINQRVLGTYASYSFIRPFPQEPIYNCQGLALWWLSWQTLSSEWKSLTRNMSRLTKRWTNTWWGMFLLHWPPLIVVRVYCMYSWQKPISLSVAVHQEIYICTYTTHITYIWYLFFTSQLIIQEKKRKDVKKTVDSSEVR